VPVDVAPTLDEVIAVLATIARPGDVVITLGAGSIGTLPDRLVEAFLRGAQGGSRADEEP